MPIVHFKTNLPQSKLTTEFVQKLSALLAETSTKPESLCQVTAQGDVLMMLGGSTEPTANVEYICIGVIGGDYNAEVSGKFAALGESELGIHKNRFYLKFVDVKAADIGTHGSNCAIVYDLE